MSARALLVALVLLAARVAVAEETTAAPSAPTPPPVAAPADAPPPSAPVDPEIFTEALADFHAQRYESAAAGFYGYLHFGGPTVENYEWSQFFLAESLAALGLWHAAVQYYTTVAKTRSQPEVLPEALARLEEVSRTRPFDEWLVDETLLYDSELGALPDTLHDWVHYVQGLEDLRHGFAGWSQAHFDAIHPGSHYALAAAYAQAVSALEAKKTGAALAQLRAVADSPIDAPETKNQANLAVARLLFEKDQLDEAAAYYARVKQIDLSFQQAQLLIEKAWTAYGQRDFKKAMGLLHALDAPSYAGYILPDVYLLRGQIFRQLCHFMLAKRTVRAFARKYDRPLRALYARRPMMEIDAIRDAAVQDGALARRAALVRTLAAERRRIEDHDAAWEEVGLDEHLRRLYDFAQHAHERAMRPAFAAEAERIANNVLDAEEQIRLLDYEIGLDIFKRVKGGRPTRGPEEDLSVPYDSNNVYYELDGEYWNDELHDYQYFVTDRCFEGEASE